MTDKNIKNNRYLGALILSPFVIFLFLGGVYLKYGVLILSLMGLYEFYNVVKYKDIHPISIPMYIITIFYYIFLNAQFNFSNLFYIILLITLIFMCIPTLNTKYTFVDIGATLLGFIYVSVFFSFIVLTNQKENGEYLIWLIFISSWLCDTTAYYVGRLLGKHKLCPKVSPKKTIEGSIGGLLGSAISCGIFGTIITSLGIMKIPLYHFIFIGLICGAFCQFGDLFASSIKRYAERKDYSHIIPGHGGILDRFDSILFASIVVYYYITFIIGL